MTDALYSDSTLRHLSAVSHLLASPEKIPAPESFRPKKDVTLQAAAGSQEAELSTTQCHHVPPTLG